MLAMEIIIFIKTPSHDLGFEPNFIMIIIMKIKISYQMLMIFILMVPTQYFLMTVFLCENFDTCFSGQHIIWFVISIISQGLVLLINVYCSILFKENMPMSPLVWSSYDGIFHIVNYALLLSVPILYCLGNSFDILNECCIVVVFISMVCIVLRWREGGYHNEWINSLTYFKEIFVLVSHLGAFIGKYIDETDNLFYIAFVLSLLLFTIVVICNKLINSSK